MSDNLQDTPVSRAIQRRKELQDVIKASMKDIEKIDEFLRMWRHLSADADAVIKGVDDPSTTLLGHAGRGQTQPMFEQYVREILREVGRPMQSSEIIKAFRDRGHPLGGNETRTAWNRLWIAKGRGVLQNIPNYGYWLADEQVPASVLSAPPPKRKPNPKGKSLRDSWVGKPKGRKRALSDGQIKTLEEWLTEGKKTQTEMARDLGGISVGTVNNYRKALIKRLAEEEHRTGKKVVVPVSPRKPLKR
jgi:hypothetical protein